MRGLRIIIGAIVAVVLLSAGAPDRAGLHPPAAVAAAHHGAGQFHAHHDHAHHDGTGHPCDADRAPLTSCCPALAHGCNPLVMDCCEVVLALDARVSGGLPAGEGGTARGLRPEAETPPPRA